MGIKNIVETTPDQDEREALKKISGDSTKDIHDNSVMRERNYLEPFT